MIAFGDRPPAPARRVVQVTGLRDACCLQCGRHLRDVAKMRNNGQVQCAKCDGYSYVIPAPGAGLAIVTHVTARELEYAAAQQMDEPQFCAFLGLGQPFIASPLLKPDR